MPVLPEATTIGTSASAIQQTRLGQISFINCLPVALPIERGFVPVSATTMYGTPAELNTGISDAALDVSAMSSSFFLRQGKLDLVPALSISSRGPVGTVLFFSRVPTHKLAGARIAVPSSSATSVSLLRVLLLEQLNAAIEVVPQSVPNLNDPDIQGALVIGDRALAVDTEWSNKYWRADLGQWWYSRTGLPMVFGVWAARSNWARSHEEEFHALSESLRKAVDLGLSTLLPAVVAEARKRTGLESIRLHKYYQQEISYELGPGHREGLEHFKKLCQDYRLL